MQWADISKACDAVGIHVEGNIISGNLIGNKLAAVWPQL